MRELILQLACCDVVNVKLIPAAAFGGPQNLLVTIKKLGKRFARVYVRIGLGDFINEHSLIAGARIHFAQFDGLFAALVVAIIKMLTVRKPAEARSADELNFERRSFDLDALARLEVKNYRRGLRQNFPGQRIDVIVGAWPKLIRRNVLQAG